MFVFNILRAGLFLLPCLHTALVLGEGFNYDNPNKWITAHRECGGSRQSPIALQSKNAISIRRQPLLFRDYHIPLRSPLKLANNGHTAHVELGTAVNNRRPSVTGGGLRDEYRAVELHFHWGSPRSRGSEHTIDGVKYSAEMHIVHRNAKYATNEEAYRDPNGLIVLAVLFKESTRRTESVGLSQIFEALPHIRQPNSERTLRESFNLGSILAGLDPEKYFTYKGSLTTPPCSEAVTWFVFYDIVPIRYDDLQRFWQLKDSRGEPLLDNWRPIQRTKERRVHRHDD